MKHVLFVSSVGHLAVWDWLCFKDKNGAIFMFIRLSALGPVRGWEKEKRGKNMKCPTLQQIILVYVNKQEMGLGKIKTQKQGE